MRWRFKAIDGGGRVVRAVMAAETEEEARELLLGENVFPKRIEPAGEDEKVTWAPKERIKARIAAGQLGTRKTDDTKPIRAIFDTTCVTGFSAPLQGSAGLAEDGTFVFAAGSESLRISPDQVEVAAISGFPRRLLRITLLSGKMYEFVAGFLFAKGASKLVARSFRQRP